MATPTVRAKFRVHSISDPRTLQQWDAKKLKNVDREVVDLQLFPVSTGSEENETFYGSTPSGSVLLSVVNKAVADQFEVNKEYYVDFTPAEENS